MATETRHSGTLRTDQEANLARPGDFPVMEGDRDRLLHRLVRGSKGALRSLLENHVLTVLADIRRKRLSGYGDTFADAQGTAALARYTQKLRENVEDWKTRLEAYLQVCWQRTGHDTPAAEVAHELYERLSESLPQGKDTDKQDYYRMLRTVTAIQENIDCYRQQAEEGGGTEPSLALLLAYLKNYGSIADTFNRRLALLPELYLHDILHARPKAAEPDNTYVVITPTETVGGFILAKGTAFPAGEELVYSTTKEEYLSPMQCAMVNAVYISPQKLSGLYRQPLPCQDAPNAQPLFTHGKELHIGWQITSPMLVLNEGIRKVNVCFYLTADSPAPDISTENSFILQLSTAEGWTQQSATCTIDRHSIRFDFMIERKDIIPALCLEEVHDRVTEYPALRILTDNTNSPYRWAKEITVDTVEIQTEVSGIRNFTLCNELGEADTTQPFQPFGIQGERDAWFLFGNGEMGLKPLQKATLKGKWKGLPETKAEFDRLYWGYDADADAFTVATDYRQDGEWKQCGKGQKLFNFDTETNVLRANIIIPFGDGINSFNTSDYDKDGFFRVTLESPSIGFGTEAYRKRFMEVMIHNSRCKEKHRREIPWEPSVPLLADTELSYTATAKISPADRNSPIIRLERITALPEQIPCATDGNGAFPFLLSAPAEYLLYFAFARAEGEKTVRMYIDMALPGEHIPFGCPQPDKRIQVRWELWNGISWQSIPSESVEAEETNGFTQSGFVEITLPGIIDGRHTDRQDRMWLRAALTGDISASLAIRNVWTNCIRVTADNGDGTPLPAGTVVGTTEVDGRLESVAQPLPGFGGRTAETETQYAVRQQMRLHNRHRAVTMRDYEELVLEHFPEVDKVQCLSIPCKDASLEVCLVVFSRAEDSRYFLSPAWKLEEIRRKVSRYMPSYVPLKVFNPVYEQKEIYFKAVLRDKVQDDGRTLRQLVVLAQDYIAPWYRKGEIPETGRIYSCKALYARMANHENLMPEAELKVDDIVMTFNDIELKKEDKTFGVSHPWNVLLPKVKIELLSSGDGIGKAGIEKNFIIR